MTVLAPTPKARFVDNNGNALAGGKLFTYLAGTTTKTATYTDAGGLTPNTNPIILDARGECDLWIDEGTGFKFTLAPATDTDPPTNPIWTVDQIEADSVLNSDNFWSGTNEFTNTTKFDASITMGPSTRITGDMSNATAALRVLVQTNVVNGATSLGVIPNGTSDTAELDLFANQVPNNTQILHLALTSGSAALQVSHVGTAADIPFAITVGQSYMHFDVNSVEAFRASYPNQQLLIATTSESAVANVKFRNAKRMQLDDTCFVQAVGNGGAGQAIASGAFTKCTLFTVENFDQAGAFSASRFTPPSGYYDIAVGVSMLASVANTRFQVSIYKNGAAIVTGVVGHESSAAPINCTAHLKDFANGTDFYEVYCWQNTGAGQTLSALPTDTYFMAHRIG